MKVKYKKNSIEMDTEPGKTYRLNEKLDHL